MKNYKSILVAIDFSEMSKHAARRAVELARFYQANLVFMHIIEHFPEHLTHYQITGENMDPEEFLINRAEKDLKALCAELRGDTVETVVRLTKHSAKNEVLEFADERHIDLIVLGSHGHHRLTEILAGSTATGIVRSATCDVFIVRRVD